MSGGGPVPTRRSLLGASFALPAALALRGGGWELVQDPDVQEPAAPPEPAAPGDAPVPSERVRAFERMAFGLFLHYGLYSQLGAGEWAMHMQRIPKERYMALMKSFHAKDFSGRELGGIARRAGMRYATLTSRHHDGFSLYDTRGLSELDVTKTPAGRDLVLDFAEGCREQGVVPMLYCTTLDWSDPRFESDWDAYQQYLRASIELLATQYGEIGGFWFDGNWSKPDADWQLDALYGVIRKHQPDALIINNTGLEQGGKLGHPEIDSVTFERGRAAALDRRGMSKYVAGEMCHTFNFHWGIAHKDFNSLSPAHVIEELCLARRAGANLLMNVGPEASGRIPDFERAALARVGDWIELAGGGKGPIYAGDPCAVVGEERDFGLQVGDDLLYLFVFDLTPTADSRHGVPSRGPGPRKFRGVTGEWGKPRWLDNGEELASERSGDELVVQATKYPYGTNTVVRIARLQR
jgi:alpha-L-fucosidase